MANHQNTNMEFSKSMQELWFATLMHSTDIEKTHQELRQSIIETHQSIKNSLNTTYEEAISHSLSLTDGLSDKDKEELLKETHEMFLEINKSIGMDEQGLQAKIEQELIELENIKNQVIDIKQRNKKQKLLILSIVILTIIFCFFIL